MASKFNWVEIEKEYITTDTTLKQLSEKYNISFQYMKIKCNKCKWTSKREKYLEKLLDKTTEKIAESTASTIARATENLAKNLEKASNELHIHEEFNMFGKLIKGNTETVRVGKLTSLVKSLTLLQKIEIEKERLKIEKEKLNNSDDTENKLDELLETIKAGLKDE